MKSKKSKYLPEDENGKRNWLRNFSTKLPSYMARYGITADEAKDMVESSFFLEWTMNCCTSVADYSKSWTSFKKELIYGTQKDVPSNLIPVAPVFAPVPTEVAPDIFRRATSIGNRIKDHVNYTISDGNDLGLEGAETVLDLHEVKPHFTIILNGGHPEIKWRKGDMTMIELLVDRGTGVFEFFTIASGVIITDNHELPPVGKAESWKYKAIFRVNDQRVGEWSDVGTIVVGN